MKKALRVAFLILGLIHVNQTFAQSSHIGKSRDFQWLMQLRPNMTHSAYWFLWSGGSTAITIDAQIENPTSWISEIIIEDPTSTSCSDIKTMQVNVVAPGTPGIYNATILDLNSNYDPIQITLLVSDELIPLDSLNLTTEVNQEILIPEPRINDGNSGLGCLDPFYPSTSQSYEFFWISDGIPGTISTTPAVFSLLNDEQIILQNSAIFTQAGNYTAFRIGKVEFSSALWVLRVNFTVTESPTGINSFDIKEARNAYPNPANTYVVLPSSEEISILSLDGRIIKTISGNTNSLENQVDISELSSGIYFAKSNTSFFKIIKK